LDWVSDSFLLGNARVAVASASKATGQGMDPAMLVQALKPVLADPTAEKLVAAMDQAGVGLSCICAVDYGLLTGSPASSPSTPAGRGPWRCCAGIAHAGHSSNAYVDTRPPGPHCVLGQLILPLSFGVCRSACGVEKRHRRG